MTPGLTRRSTLWAAVAALSVLCSLVPVQSQVPASVVSAVVKIVGTRQGTPVVGSGFVVALDRGAAIVVTSSHVIEGVPQFQVTFAADSAQSLTVREVLSLETENRNGLAVFRVTGGIPPGVTSLALDGNAGPAPGQSLFLLGYPQASSTALTLSRVYSGRKGLLYVLDQGVAEGVSGGPVLLEGRVVGLMTATEERFSYAVPSGVIRQFLEGSGVRLPDGGARTTVVNTTPASVASGTPVSPSERRAGEVFQDCEDCPELVVVPAGTFTMGSPESEDERFSNEGPTHAVSVQTFALGKYEVTRSQFQTYIMQTSVKVSGCHSWNGNAWVLDASKSWQSPGFAQTGTDPVVCMSWNHAMGYVKWLAQRTKRSYRLPSEAEWEYAARAGTTTRRYWGNSADQACNYANVADQPLQKAGFTGTGGTFHGCSDGYVYTAVVGKFAGNKFGVYDILGNAWEWVEDCFHDNYTGAPPTGEPWTVGSCTSRMSRGGSWNNLTRSVRSAMRFGSTPSSQFDSQGFRVARALP